MTSRRKKFGRNLWSEWNQDLVKYPSIFSASEIVERTLSGMAESNKESLRTVPLNFKVMVEPIEGEAETKNNQVVFSIDANMRKNQLLILDSRPRWETRYLNNLFERDERWEVSAYGENPRMQKGNCPEEKTGDKFPEQRKASIRI